MNFSIYSCLRPHGHYVRRNSILWGSPGRRSRQPRAHRAEPGDSSNVKRTANLSTEAQETTPSSNQQDQKGKSSSRLKDVVKKLSELGPPGIASYGILNSMYYTGVVSAIFLLQRPDSAIGLQLATRKLGEAFLSAWALSQITKVPRALGAIALAPLTNTFMMWLIKRTWIENRRQALIAITFGCIVIVATVMGGLLVTVM